MNQLDDAEAIFGQMVSDPGGAFTTAPSWASPKCASFAAMAEIRRILITRRQLSFSPRSWLARRVKAQVKPPTYWATVISHLAATNAENKKTALAYYLRASLLMSGPHGEEAAFRSGQCDKALGNPQIGAPCI